MKTILQYIFILFSILAYAEANAQNIVKHFTIEDGLPSNEVYFVHQDDNGYYWFCTDRGISRYNGYEFKNFTIADGLTSNVVFKCFQDWNGDLWFTCMDGSVMIYNQKERKFREFEHTDWLKSRYNIQSWVHNIGFRSDKKEVSFFFLRNNILNDVFRMDSLGKEIELDYQDIVKEEGLYDNFYLFGLRRIRSKKYWQVAYWGHSVPKNEVVVDNYVIPDFSNYPSLHYIDSSLYCSTSNGVLRQSKAKESSSIFQEISASSLLKDAEGLTWVTSNNSGVYVIADKTVQAYDQGPRLAQNEKISLGKELRGKLVLGLLPGKFMMLDLEKEAFEVFEGDYHFKRFNTLFYNDDSSGIYFGNKMLLASDAESRLRLVDTKPIDFGSFKASFNGISYSQGETPSNFSSTLKIEMGKSALIYGVDFTQWVIDHNLYGKRYYDGSTGLLRTYAFYDEYVYIGTGFGLAKMYTSGREKEIVNLGETYKSLGVSDLDTISDVTIISSKGHGVLGVKDDEVIAVIDKEGGLLSQIVNDIYIDRKCKEIWCGTGDGVSVFQYRYANDSLSFFLIKNIRKIDGLYSSYINYVTPLGDNMVAISDRGVTTIPKEYTPLPSAPPNVVLRGYVINDSLYSSSDEHFDYDQNNVEFHYEAVSMRKDKGTYQYRLVREGDSVAWSVTDERTIRVNNIAPGNYAFQVRARRADSGWGVPSSYTFTIEKRFIDRWWVRSVLAFILFAIGYLIFANRLKRLREKDKLLLSNQDLELQVAKLEAASLRGQMNPHFMFNVLNSIQKLILIEEKEDANKLLARFSKLMRSSLEYSRLEYISLSEEVTFLENYMSIEAQRFPNRFTHSIHMAEELLADASIPPLLIQPLCENCIKHAFVEDGGTISVHISVKDEELLQIVVEDNGIGIRNTDTLKKSSLGTTIVRDRIKLIQRSGETASLKIETANKTTKKGTRATLILPYT